MQLKTTRATVFLATFALAVWSSPVRPVYDSRFGTLNPAWISPTYGSAIYDGLSSSSIHPIVPHQPHHWQPISALQGLYVSPLGIQRPLRPLIYLYPSTNYVFHDVGDLNANNKLYNTRADLMKDEVIVSSIEQIPRETDFSDKSLLFTFFNQFGLSNRFVQRLSSFPSIKVTYKNITLTGIEIG